MADEHIAQARLNLHRLELLGFKSFPEKIDLLFHPGITGIVGPNGCGKSNITDSISWVLGEQSAKSLRGEKMEDVIFSGTEKRDALGLAQVTLTLKIPVGEQRELVVSRRLFRDGESQYFMNGSACRLRDIQDTIFDTGMGTKSYFLIEQGRIGEILKSKPTDRRLLIEEAAGISKYRAKKHMAELKLESSKQNLERVRDIITEVRKQMNSLKRQAALARRYERLSGEKVRLQKLLIALQLRRLSAEMDVAEVEYQRTREHEVALRARLSAAELDVERGDLAAIETERIVEETREVVFAAKLAIRNDESEIARAKTQKENLLLLLDQNRRQVTTIAEKSERTQIAIQERQTLGREITAELEAAEKSLQDARAELQRRESEAQRQAERAQQIRLRQRDATARSATAKNDLLAVSSERSKLEGVENRLRQEGERLRARLAELESRLEQFRVDLATQEEDFAALTSSLQDLSSNEGAERSALAAAEASLSAIDQQRSATSNRLDALTAIEEGRALVPESVRTILTRYAGQIAAPGVFSDFIEVTDPSLAWTVENCLRSVLNGIVLDASADVPSTILTMREPGAVTYVPLGLLRAADTSSVPPPCPALAEFVKVDPSCGQLTALLSGIYIAESLEEAMRLRESHPAAAFAVRGDGTCLLPTGTVLAGRPAEKEESILWIKTEVRRLQAEMSMLEGRRGPVVEEVERRRQAVESLVMQLEDLRSRHSLREREAMLARQRESQSLEERRDLGDHLSTITAEMEHATAERSAASTRQSALEEQVSAIDGEIEEIARMAEESEQHLAEAQQARNETRDTVTRNEASCEALAVRLRSLESELQRLEAELRELRAESDRCVDEIQAQVAQVEDLDRGRLVLEEQIVVRIRDLEAKEADLSERERTLASMRAEGAQAHESLKLLRAEHQQAQETRSHAELLRAEKGRDIAHLRTTCLDEFHQTPEEVAAGLEAPPAPVAPVAVEIEEAAEEGEVLPAAPAGISEDAEAVGAELELRKAQLDKMGPINLRATEDYTQAKERYDFLSAQERDLLEAIKATIDAITEMDREGRERFKEAFAAINGNFGEVYRHLFGGGAAEMRLMEAEDLLESGIEIVAQPPGKKQLPLPLFSGGEKALTALALLFAIFQYKPSPFCIMDEVDAPLDETNTDRFLRLLEAYSDRTQFILITHNVKTMQAADTLYGITMQERGISKIVSVKMREVEVV